MNGRMLIGLVVLAGGIGAIGFASCTPETAADRKGLNRPGNAVAAHDPVIVVTGDMSCTGGDSGTGNQQCADRDFSDANGSHPGTASLASSLNPDYLILLGDLQYPNGSQQDFLNSPPTSFGAFTPIWWNHGNLTPDKFFPVPGNHEYRTTAAGGYFARFGSAGTTSVPPGGPDQGYYAFDIPTTGGTWRAIALNSGPCTEPSTNPNGNPIPWDSTDTLAARQYRSSTRCDASSAQTAWLNSELANNHHFCTLAFWHHQAMSSTGAESVGMNWWRTLANATNQADIVMWGHQHNLEEFTPQRCTSSSCAADPNGTKAFIAGLGGIANSGSNCGGQSGITCPANTVFRFAPGGDKTKFALLKLVLHSTTYDYSYIASNGSVLESGSGACHDPAGSGSGTISGTVTNFQTGSAIANASVSGGGASTTSAANGSYTLANVPAGTVTVTATASGYLTRTFSVAVTGGATSTQNIQLSTAGKIVGNVTGGGASLSGATVAISGGQIPVNQSVVTDSTGHYDEQWIPIGSYTVTCSAPGFAPQSLPATVTTGNITTINCALAASGCNEQPVITEPSDGESADIGSAINLHVSAGSCVTTMKVYIDGVEVQTIAGNVSPVPPSTTNWIGGYSEGVQHQLVVVGFNNDAGTASTTVHFTWP